MRGAFTSETKLLADIERDKMERNINYFAAILVSFSLAGGIVAGFMLGAWSLPLAFIAAVVGNLAVNKYCNAGPSNDLKG